MTSSLREPLRPALIADGFADTGLAWPLPILHATVGSTNAQALHLAMAGAPEGTCVVAEEQTAGRGRHRRPWVSPPGAGLWVSVVVELGEIPVGQWGLLPLASGLALADAVAGCTGLRPALKWPNDLLVSSGEQVRKLAGILVEVCPPSDRAASGGRASRAVVGMGLNVAMDDLPPGATCLVAEGAAPTSREALLVAELQSLHARLQQVRNDPQGLTAQIRERCTTIGREVQISLPAGELLRGRAIDIADDGSLEVLDAQAIRRFITAGDVIHATI